MPNRDVLKGDWLPNISVDCVIFGFQENQLKVLLLKFKNNEVWTLPGGFIGKEEDADEAAKRIMNQRPAMREAILEKFGPDAYVNGELNRAHLSKIVFSILSLNLYKEKKNQIMKIYFFIN